MNHISEKCLNKNKKSFLISNEERRGCFSNEAKKHEQKSVNSKEVKRTSWNKGLSKVSKEEIVNDIKYAYSILGSDLTSSKYLEVGEIKKNYYLYKYGGFKSLCREAGISLNHTRKIGKDKIANDLKKIYKEYGFLNKELYEREGVYSPTGVRGSFGSFNQALRECELPINMNKKVGKQEVLSRMSELIEEYGYLDSKLQREKSGYSQLVIDTIFGSFNSMLKEMGIPLNKDRLSKEELILQLKKAYEKHGRISRYSIEDSCSITYEACCIRFGGIKQLLIEIGADVEKHFLETYSHGLNSLKEVAETCLGEDAITEKSWEWLKSPHSNKKMRVDLFFPKNNIAIEYDGDQHFKFIEFFHKNEEGYNKQKEKDIEKEKLLEENNIPLLRFNKHTLKEELIKDKIYSV